MLIVVTWYINLQIDFQKNIGGTGKINYSMILRFPKTEIIIILTPFIQYDY